MLEKRASPMCPWWFQFQIFSILLLGANLRAFSRVDYTRFGSGLDEDKQGKHVSSLSPNSEDPMINTSHLRVPRTLHAQDTAPYGSYSIPFQQIRKELWHQAPRPCKCDAHRLGAADVVFLLASMHHSKCWQPLKQNICQIHSSSQNEQSGQPCPETRTT